MKDVINVNKNLLLMAILSLGAVNMGCGKSGSVSMQFGSYTVASARQGGAATMVAENRPQIKQDEDNVDLSLGLVTLDASGTGLGTVEIPEGDYTRVEFDLEDDCAGANGNSLSIENSGTFNSTDRITIRFDGNFTVSSVGSTLEMSIQSIMTALNSETNDGSATSQELKDAAEGASGTF